MQTFSTKVYLGSFFQNYNWIIQVHWVPRRRQGHPTPVLLPGKSHGWGRLVGYHLWGRTESDTTERLHFLFSLSCMGEGNGNPLQCSCLENPRDGGAWWATIYGVAQSRTRVKWLSSSSSSIECLLHARQCAGHWGWGERSKDSSFSHILLSVRFLSSAVPALNHTEAEQNP